MAADGGVLPALITHARRRLTDLHWANITAQLCSNQECPMIRAIFVLILIMLLAGCGPQAPAVAPTAAPTETAVPPTATPLPPTATATPMNTPTATATSTPLPSATPTSTATATPLP